MEHILTWLSAHWTLWTFIGLFGQSLFMMRFVMQWIASEKVRQSVIPNIFWYFSLGGGVILLIYAIHQQDIVFMLGQGLGLFIYMRNIYFIHRGEKKADA